MHAPKSQTYRIGNIDYTFYGLAHERILQRNEIIEARNICYKCKTNDRAPGRRICDACGENRRIISQRYYDRKKRHIANPPRDDWYGRMIDYRLAHPPTACAICGLKRSKRMHLDHDHATGKIREYLCSQCNTGLGMFADNTDYMVSAIKYLKRHRTHPLLCD